MPDECAEAWPGQHVVAALGTHTCTIEPMRELDYFVCHPTVQVLIAGMPTVCDTALLSPHKPVSIMLSGALADCEVWVWRQPVRCSAAPVVGPQLDQELFWRDWAGELGKHAAGFKPGGAKHATTFGQEGNALRASSGCSVPAAGCGALKACPA